MIDRATPESYNQAAFSLPCTGQRRTIARDVSVQGVGLHLGRSCTLVFRPAPSGAGVHFVRSDVPYAEPVPALVRVAVEAQRRTQLGDGDAAFHTVEHVLAAVYALGVDDLRIELDAAEPPIMDGSAAPFLRALLDAGIVANGGTLDWLVVRKPLEVTIGESTYRAIPHDRFELAVTIAFDHPLIGRQALELPVSAPRFATELAAARTFGFVGEVEGLRAMGLIQGASTDNALVLDQGSVVGNTLRWPDEFVRHKALDCLGDLALAGARLRAKITADRPSHSGTIRFVRHLVEHAVREPAVYTVEDIMEVLPHRYPFLLVDRILEVEEGKRIVGLKNVTINEPFFQGHFPGHPIMPGVLIIESMAQVGGMLLMRTIDDPKSKVVYFMSVDKVKFRRPVKPGDQLRVELDVVQMRGSTCRMRGVARVDGEVATEAEFAAIVRDR